MPKCAKWAVKRCIFLPAGALLNRIVLDRVGCAALPLAVVKPCDSNVMK